MRTFAYGYHLTAVSQKLADDYINAIEAAVIQDKTEALSSTSYRTLKGSRVRPAREVLADSSVKRKKTMGGAESISNLEVEDVKDLPAQDVLVRLTNHYW